MSSAVARREETAPLPWERQRGESSKAFWAFESYRDLGAGRSLSKVREIAGETGVVSPSMIERWSSKWKWIERTDAWDREEHRKRLAERDRAISDARRLDTMAGTLAMGLAISRLRGDAQAPGGPVEAIDANDLSAGDVTRLIDVGSRSLARGLGEYFDARGNRMIEGAVFNQFTYEILGLALARFEEIAAAASAIDAESPDGIVARHSEAFVEDVEALFRRTVR